MMIIVFHISIGLIGKTGPILPSNIDFLLVAIYTPVLGGEMVCQPVSV